MIRRIRIESKSILDNYDFSLQVIPRLKVLFDEYMKNHRLNQYLLRATTQLFVAQETNLAFMLEYIVTRELLQKQKGLSYGKKQKEQTLLQQDTPQEIQQKTQTEESNKDVSTTPQHDTKDQDMSSRHSEALAEESHNRDVSPKGST